MNIIHIFNPEIIILGRSVTQIGDALLEPVKRIVQERAMAVSRDAVQIVQAKLGQVVGLVGAGTLAYAPLS